MNYPINLLNYIFIKKTKYRDFTIESYKNKITGYYISICKLGIILNEYNKELNNYCYGFNTLEQSIESTKKYIKNLYSEKIYSIAEFTQKLNKYLVKDYLGRYKNDKVIVKILLEIYLKNK